MPGMEGTMKEFKEGTLKSSSGQKVTERDQAIAIGMSEEGKSKPKKKSSAKAAIMKKHMKNAHKEWNDHPDNPHNAIRM